MATKAKATEAAVEQTANVENVESGRINLMPNWENTSTWMMLCKQIMVQRVKTQSATNALKRIDAAKTESEKFAIIGKYFDDQITTLLKRIETIKSMSEVAHYEESICKKKEEVK